MATPKGYPTSELEDRLELKFATVEPIREKQNGLTVLAHSYVVKITDADQCETGSTATKIKATAHGALVGDIVYFRTGNLAGQEVKVWSIVDADYFYLAEELSEAPANGDQFDLLRHKYPAINNEGEISVTTPETSVGATGAAVPASATFVAGTDGTNLRGLSVDSSGRLIEAPNTAGSSPGSSTVSTVATLTAPAGAVGFILMNLDTSTAGIRYRIGAVATSSSGQQLQPGRDTGYIPCAANISICAESGTQNYDVQWILRA